MSLGIPRKQFGPAVVTILHQDSFTDHTSTQGISAYFGRRLASLSGSSSDNAVLPPRFCFQVYVTYGPVSEDAISSSLVSDFVSRAMADANRHGQFNCPIRFDFYFTPGQAEANQIISHYHAEGRAIPDYSKRKDESFSGLAVLLSKENWTTDGVDLLFFDPPPGYLQQPPEAREAILGPGVSDEGVLAITGVSLQQGEPNGLSVRLRDVAESNPKWDQFTNEYQEAVEQGKTAW